MNETYNLELRFKNDSNKATKLTIREPKVGLTDVEVRPVMDALSTSGLFIKKGENPYATVDEARYVRTTVEEIFTAEETTI